MSPARILIADDHAVLRAGLAALLNAEPDLQVVGEASDGIEAVRKARDLQPDVVLMDISMPGFDGLEAVRRARAVCPDARFLILTMHDSDEYLFRALEAGASGYLVKRSAHTELIDAIRAVYRGEAFLYPSAVMMLIKDHLEMLRGGGVRASEPQLTERQADVLRLVAEGYSNHEIAEQLCVSVKTVEKHKSEIMDKLGLGSRSDLVRYAIKRGILSPQT